jgi:hypothetical protein
MLKIRLELLLRVPPPRLLLVPLRRQRPVLLDAGVQQPHRVTQPAPARPRQLAAPLEDPPLPRARLRAKIGQQPLRLL